MKKRYSSAFSLIIISLLILLFTGQGLASGFVLCIGENGHSAYEHSLAGKCAPSETSCPVRAACNISSCSVDHCGPCQDYVTNFDSLSGRVRSDLDISTSVSLPDISAVSIPAVTVFLRDLTANLSPLPPPRPYTALIALRTVVLLN